MPDSQQPILRLASSPAADAWQLAAGPASRLAAGSSELAAGRCELAGGSCKLAAGGCQLAAGRCRIRAVAWFLGILRLLFSSKIFDVVLHFF